MRIKTLSKDINIVRCEKCSGVGYIYKDSHDCWGKSESYEVVCCQCKGNGFILPKELVKEIKQSLGLY